jgi:hypothetical protein
VVDARSVVGWGHLYRRNRVDNNRVACSRGRCKRVVSIPKVRIDVTISEGT